MPPIRCRNPIARSWYSNALTGSVTRHAALSALPVAVLMSCRSPMSCRSSHYSRRSQVQLAQLRTGVSNSMGWYQRLIDGGFQAGHNRRCRWCGRSEETVTHVYNECDDLQLIGLRHDISTATGRALNAACLVTDPVSALEYHDRAIGFLQRIGGIVA